MVICWLYAWVFLLIGGVESIVFGPTRWCVWSFRPSSPLRLPHLKCLFVCSVTKVYILSHIVVMMPQPIGILPVPSGNGSRGVVESYFCLFVWAAWEKFIAIEPWEGLGSDPRTADTSVSASVSASVSLRLPHLKFLFFVLFSPVVSEACYI